MILIWVIFLSRGNPSKNACRGLGILQCSVDRSLEEDIGGGGGGETNEIELASSFVCVKRTLCWALERQVKDEEEL